MKIAGALQQTYPCFSFEFFAPHTSEGVPAVLETVSRLRRHNPLFVSVTYSPGEFRRRRTINMVTRIKRDLGIEAMAHLTCVGSSRVELRQKLDLLAASGIENVLALRGDVPRGETEFVAPVDGFAHASELTGFIASEYDFCIGGACYPEVHPDSATWEEDLTNLVKKVEAGAQFLVTQLFYENAHYFRFVERARAAGITVPIIPGIMPITDAGFVNRIATMDPRTTVPQRLQEELIHRADNPEAVLELGVAYTTLQCEALIRGGAPGIHFFTLNRSPATSAIVASLQVSRPWERATP